MKLTKEIETLLKKLNFKLDVNNEDEKRYSKNYGFGIMLEVYHFKDDIFDEEYDDKNNEYLSAWRVGEEVEELNEWSIDSHNEIKKRRQAMNEMFDDLEIIDTHFRNN